MNCGLTRARFLLYICRAEMMADLQKIGIYAMMMVRKLREEKVMASLGLMKIVENGVGTFAKVLRMPSFWNAGKEKGEIATLEYVGDVDLIQTGAIQIGGSKEVKGYVFYDIDTYDKIILCWVRSMGIGDRSIYGDVRSDGSVEFVEITGSLYEGRQ